MSLTQTIYEALTGDELLTGWLATYSDEPAVFTTDPPPEAAELPYIIAAGSLADTPFDTKDERGREVYRDIRCYTASTGSSELVEDIAERVRALLHRQPLVVDGGPVLLAGCTGPRNGPDEDEAYSRIVTLHVITNPA